MEANMPCLANINNIWEKKKKITLDPVDPTRAKKPKNKLADTETEAKNYEKWEMC
jgi:hypothetical protein